MIKRKVAIRAVAEKRIVLSGDKRIKLFQMNQPVM